MKVWFFFCPFQSPHRKFSCHRISLQRFHVEYKSSPSDLMIFLKGWFAIYLLFPFLSLISSYCLYFPPPTNVFPLFISNAFPPLSCPVYTYLLLKALSLFLIYYLKWGCLWEKQPFHLQFYLCLKIHQRKDFRCLLPRNIGAAQLQQGLNAHVEWSNLLMHVLGAPAASG